ncbi:hypothetical protein NQ176_g11400 [Zarea fungicola]|uniref:Uncharacterized protein n=1 Tax=Zarea fungicola TaxID=93591 RepID=A0ACC1MCN2_9HYPO|nr:hypothetical protein NQ176_g11400 [Lecanicillium fungicola]
MDVDGDSELLARVAAGETLELDKWPALQLDILSRLEKIAHTEFTIPDLPPPFVLDRCLDNGEPTSSSPIHEPSSQESDKENAPAAVQAEARSEPMQQDDKEGGEDKAKEVASTDNDTAMDKTDDTANVPESKPDDETPLQTQTQTEPVAAPSSQSIELDDNERKPHPNI